MRQNELFISKYISKHISIGDTSHHSSTIRINHCARHWLNMVDCMAATTSHNMGNTINHSTGIN